MVLIELMRVLVFISAAPLTGVLLSKLVEYSFSWLPKADKIGGARFLFLLVGVPSVAWYGKEFTWQSSSLHGFVAALVLTIAILGLYWMRKKQFSGQCSLRIAGRIEVEHHDEEAREDLHSVTANLISQDISRASSDQELQAILPKAMQRFHDVKLSHEKRLASRIRFARKHLSFKDSDFSIANLDELLDNTSAFHKTKLDRFIEDERVKLKKAIDTRSAQVSLDEPPQCPVCLRDDIASSILILRSCKHFLCAVCASQVILEANSKHRTPRCPYCRTNFMSENAVLHPNKPINSVRQLHAFIKQNM